MVNLVWELLGVQTIQRGVLPCLTLEPSLAVAMICNVCRCFW